MNRNVHFFEPSYSLGLSGFDIKYYGHGFDSHKFQASVAEGLMALDS